MLHFRAKRINCSVAILVLMSGESRAYSIPTLISTNHARIRSAAAEKLTWSQSRSVCRSRAPLDRGSNLRPVWFLLRSLRWKKNSQDHCEKYINGSVFSENTHGSRRAGKRNWKPHDTEGMLLLVRESEATNSCKFTWYLMFEENTSYLSALWLICTLFLGDIRVVLSVNTPY